MYAAPFRFFLKAPLKVTGVEAYPIQARCSGGATFIILGGSEVIAFRMDAKYPT